MPGLTWESLFGHSRLNRPGSTKEGFATTSMGMKQCLEAKKMLLMTRNEMLGFNWANTCVRIAALGMPGEDYPVTLARFHKNLRVVTDRNTLAKPKFNI